MGKVSPFLIFTMGVLFVNLGIFFRANHILFIVWWLE